MKLKNKIINYFVSPPYGDNKNYRVFVSKVTMGAETAAKLLREEEQKKSNQRFPPMKLLQVCFDVDSSFIYLPNASNFSPDQLKPLVEAGKLRISQDFGGYASRPPIEGSPFSSMRARSIENYGHAKKIIEDHYGDQSFQNLPVVEANLTRMPGTVKTLPRIYQDNKEYTGGYISPSFADSINFVDEIDVRNKKRRDGIPLLQQKTPFILINIALKNGRDTDMAEKQWAVLSGYRDFLYDKSVSEEEKQIRGDITQFADIYAIKQHLYMGWPLEEISSTLLRDVTSFSELVNGIGWIMKAVDSLKEEGYKDPATNPYYATFKIDIDDFVPEINFKVDENSRIVPSEQNKYLRILDYDQKNSFVLIESPVFISPDVCEKILKAKSRPFICQYNPAVEKIDVKSEDSSYTNLKREKRQFSKMETVLKSLLGKERGDEIEFRTGPSAQGEWAVNSNVFNTRKISDYYYAYDFIQKMCDERGIEFLDIDVIVGPISRLFGDGTGGGFMNKEQFIEKGKDIPFEISQGLWVNPPAIFINSNINGKNPTYPEQTSVLIHEYSHNLYQIENPHHKKQYGEMDAKPGTPAWLKQWHSYLTDPDEVLAHKTEVKYQLMGGKSVDEIIKEKFGAVTADNHRVALKFREMIDEVVEEMEKEEQINDKPTEKAV